MLLSSSEPPVILKLAMNIGTNILIYSLVLNGEPILLLKMIPEDIVELLQLTAGKNLLNVGDGIMHLVNR